MNREEIMNVIRELSYSQGYYSRLYYLLTEGCDEEVVDMTLTHLENQHFSDKVDLVMFIEG